VKKPGFFWKHAKSSAAVVSLALHAGLIIASVVFVAVKVIVKEDQTFETKPVARPSMPLKKLQVPVAIRKKTPKPKFRKNIVARTKVKSMEIQLPETAGVKGGTGYLDGDGTGFGGVGFFLEEIDLFGGRKGTGNELEGTFFDLKLKPDGRPARMDEEYFKEVLRNFASTWNISKFEDRYFQAPKKRFATVFMIPKIPANEAPKAYGVEKEVTPKQWVAYYKGVFAAPEDGKFRFWGIADDVMMVRVKRRLVLDANWAGQHITDWDSNDPLDKKYTLSGQGVRVGDWFHLKKDRETEIEVLIGERPGGNFFCHLLIEQDGVEYPKGKDGRPVLPIFKTRKIPEDLIPDMRIEPGTCTVDGPSYGVIQ
jgi:hypothetical protein